MNKKDNHDLKRYFDKVNEMNSFFSSPAMENLIGVNQKVVQAALNISSSLPSVDMSIWGGKQAEEIASGFRSYLGMENLIEMNQKAVQAALNISSSLPSVDMSIWGGKQAAEIASTIRSSYAWENLKVINKDMMPALKALQSLELRLEDDVDLASITEELYESGMFSTIIGSLGMEDKTDDIELVVEKDILNTNVDLAKKMDSIIDILNKIFEKQQENKIPKKDIILLIATLILPTLLAPWLQLFSTSYDEWVTRNGTQIIKVITNEIKESADRELYVNVRIVKKNGLLIKKSNRTDSPTIALLDFGEVVEIIHKKKNWTKIRTVKNQELVEGWVYTRYLQKIK